VRVSDITDANGWHSDEPNSLQQQKSDEDAKMAAKLNRDTPLNKNANLHQSLFKKDNNHYRSRMIHKIVLPVNISLSR
jgi:hypothetical protein